MTWLKPIAGEEWIEKTRSQSFWIGEKQSYPQNLYSRLTKSYVGWRLYFKTYKIWSRASLLIDPLSSGGLWSHVHCFLFNWLVVDVWWGTKNRIRRWTHPKQHKAEMRFMAAIMQASDEGCGDEMSAPSGFDEERFHGTILGKRYFERVAEILKESDKNS